jgi:elongation factor P--beta-lysine ligase
MYSSTKLQIYKGMIQYILDSTQYTLKRIAALSNSTIYNIRAIHQYDEIPPNFPEELHLVQLYQIILELEKKQRAIRGLKSL